MGTDAAETKLGTLIALLVFTGPGGLGCLGVFTPQQGLPVLEGPTGTPNMGSHSAPADGARPRQRNDAGGQPLSGIPIRVVANYFKRMRQVRLGHHPHHRAGPADPHLSQRTRPAEKASWKPPPKNIPEPTSNMDDSSFIRVDDCRRCAWPVTPRG